ncbi:hypothetical protein SBD_2238 [Streptomyces bottropensis ATCC 25435]|uniref:Uncharacterized protein n=1 Tax=Streptomyces bottropensis ATCC 25435 TaxID=1054862 RepID=M3F443_9ACTN|nr:hypothetical protein SBD_2238 [Streptomyces bottropensis ATCC 25435]
MAVSVTAGREGGTPGGEVVGDGLDGEGDPGVSFEVVGDGLDGEGDRGVSFSSAPHDARTAPSTMKITRRPMTTLTIRPGHPIAAHFLLARHPGPRARRPPAPAIATTAVPN